jgi:hypothetical protein
MDGADRPACSSIIIAAELERVWAEVERPGHLERFHPFCEANPVMSWIDDDRRDRVVYFSGLVLDRTFTAWTPPHGFRLDGGPPDDAHTRSVHWNFDPVSGAPGSTRATIAIHGGGDSGRETLEDYLDSVLLGLRHVVEGGEPVTKNQFGAHPVFSPAA